MVPRRRCAKHWKTGDAIENVNNLRTTEALRQIRFRAGCCGCSDVPAAPSSSSNASVPDHQVPFITTTPSKSTSHFPPCWHRLSKPTRRFPIHEATSKSRWDGLICWLDCIFISLWFLRSSRSLSSLDEVPQGVLNNGRLVNLGLE